MTKPFKRFLAGLLYLWAVMVVGMMVGQYNFVLGTIVMFGGLIGGVWLVVRRIFKPKKRPPYFQLPASGDYVFDIVGEASYQRALEAIAGEGGVDGVEHACTAVLTPEENNPHDANAVAVTINGSLVGYLDRAQAAAYRGDLGLARFEVAAMIVGGWQRPGGDEGLYGVKLDFSLRRARRAADAGVARK